MKCNVTVYRKLTTQTRCKTLSTTRKVFQDQALQTSLLFFTTILHLSHSNSQVYLYFEPLASDVFQMHFVDGFRLTHSNSMVPLEDNKFALTVAQKQLSILTGTCTTELSGTLFIALILLEVIDI